jgi:hypothetical protein
MTLKKKKKAGRPPMKVRDRKSTMISFRLRQDEYRRLRDEAKAAKMTISGYLLYCWQKVGQ